MVTMHQLFYRAVSDKKFISQINHSTIVIINPPRDYAVLVLVRIAMDVVTDPNENVAQLRRMSLFQSFVEFKVRLAVCPGCAL